MSAEKNFYSKKHAESIIQLKRAEREKIAGINPTEDNVDEYGIVDQDGAIERRLVSMERRMGSLTNTVILMSERLSQVQDILGGILASVSGDEPIHWPINSIEDFKRMEIRMQGDISFKENLRSNLLTVTSRKITDLIDIEVLKTFSTTGTFDRTRTTDSQLMMFIARSWTTDEKPIGDVIMDINEVIDNAKNSGN